MNVQELLDRLVRFEKRLEMEGRYTDQNLVAEAVRVISSDYPEREEAQT